MARGRKRQSANVNDNGGNPARGLEDLEDVPRQEEPTMANRPEAPRIDKVSRAIFGTDDGNRGSPQQSLHGDVSSREGAFSST